MAYWYKPPYTYHVRRLQSVLDASARMIFQLRRSDHIPDALASFPERIQFKIAVLTYKVLHETAPRYLGPRSSICPICPVGVVSALPAPIAWSCRHSNCLLLAVELLMLVLLEHGTVCQRMCRTYSRPASIERAEYRWHIDKHLWLKYNNAISTKYPQI